jgi:signal recognition particle subunit SRP54
MAQMMTKMASMGMRDRLKAINDMKNGGLLNPGATLNKQKQGTGKRLTADERTKLRKQREKDLRKRKRDQKRGPGDQNGRSADDSSDE